MPLWCPDPSVYMTVGELILRAFISAASLDGGIMVLRRGDQLEGNRVGGVVSRRRGVMLRMCRE